MTDIVERLRVDAGEMTSDYDWRFPLIPTMYLEAAAEIERLRAIETAVKAALAVVRPQDCQAILRAALGEADDG